MEFDNNAPVSDEQRKLAEAKRVTLQPIHTDIAPDPRPDAEIAANHLVEPPVANTSNDTEQETRPIEPSASIHQVNAARSKSQLPRIALIVASFLILVVLAILYMNVK